jgi:long-chain acyl-CoA synthetase
MKKIWLEQYPEGVPDTIDNTQYSSLVQLIEESFDKYRSNAAYTNLGVTLSYADLDMYSGYFASYLQNVLHLKKGSRVAIMMPNLLQYPVALYGILRAGMVAVNVNPLYTARELKHQLNDSGAEAMIILANFAHTLCEVIDDTPVRRVVVTEIGDMCPWPKRSIVNFMVKYVKKMVPAYDLPKSDSLHYVMAKGKLQPHSSVELGHDDIAFIQYTGGTTGVSKGAVLTHRNMVSNVLQAEAWFKPLINTSNEAIITALPLYHIFSLTANCLLFSKLGGENILITNPRDLPAFVATLKSTRFTCITGVNTLFNALAHTPGIEEVDWSNVVMSFGGGMAVQEAVAKQWQELTGTILIEGYGLTETSPAAVVNPMDTDHFSGTIGVPISSTEVAIRDNDGNDVPIGEPGEVCIRGPQVMQGYWQRPEETAEVMTEDGFFKTGDVGFMNEKGYIKLVDRKKDMILVSGFNVYPNELEEVVAHHPDILEVAAIGVPDEHSGEVVKLFIVPKNDSLTEEAVMEYCKENLTGYKRPKHIEFMTELPKTNVGKVLRKDLRAREAAS